MMLHKSLKMVLITDCSGSIYMEQLSEMVQTDQLRKDRKLATSEDWEHCQEHLNEVFLTLHFNVKCHHTLMASLQPEYQRIAKHSIIVLMTILTYLTSLFIHTLNAASPEASEIFQRHRCCCLLVCWIHPSVLCSWSHLIIFLQLFIAILWEHQPESGDLFSTDAKPINVSRPTASIFPFLEHRFSLNDKKLCILIYAFSFIGEKRMRPDLR